MATSAQEIFQELQKQKLKELGRDAKKYKEFVDKGGEVDLLITALNLYKRGYQLEQQNKVVDAPRVSDLVTKVPSKVGVAAGKAMPPSVPLIRTAHGQTGAQPAVFNTVKTVTRNTLREGRRPGESEEQFNQRLLGGIEIILARSVPWVGDYLTNEQIDSLVKDGIKAAKDEFYYEQTYKLGERGKLVGAGVKNLERLGKVTSTVAQKTPGVGGLLFGTVRNTATQTQKMDPRIRSVLNKARIELQKNARNIYQQKYEKRLDEYTEDAEKIKRQLKEKLDRLEAVERELKEIERLSRGGTATSTPTDEPDKDEGGGLPFG